MLVTMLGLALQGRAQSNSEQADRIGIVGFWKMMEMGGRSGGEDFYQELDGSNFYIFKSNGTCQYSTKEHKIADAKWTLKGKELHVWGNDTINDPDGIDYTFTLIMVTPEKLNVRLGDGEDYVGITFRKSNATLKQVGSSTTKKQPQTNRGK